MRGALVVLLLLVRPAAAQNVPPAAAPSTCDPAEAASLRAHLEHEQHSAKRWNVVWGAIYGGLAVASFGVAIADPFPDQTPGFYVGGTKSAIGALSRVITPLRIPVPPIDADVCTDIANLHKAVKTAARHERGNFYLNHFGAIFLNGAGGMILWHYSDGKKALINAVTGYPVGLLSVYTAPRGSWHLYRDSQWSVGVVPQQGAWLVTVGGEL